MQVLHHNNSHTSGIDHLSTTNKCSNSLMHVAEQPANAQSPSGHKPAAAPGMTGSQLSVLLQCPGCHELCLYTALNSLQGPCLPPTWMAVRTHTPWLRPFASDPNQLWGI